jgi:hypothetical protein
MPIIKAGEATKPTHFPTEPVYPLFPATGDIQQVQRWDKEAFQLWCNRYKYYILDVVGSFPDKVYGEPTDIEAGGEVYVNQDDPLFVPCYVHWNEEQKELGKWGQVLTRDIVLEFSALMLNEMSDEVPPDGLSPARGDVIIIDETEFVIQEVKRGQPWFGNVQFPIHIFCPATIKKSSNITDDRPDTTLNTSPEHYEGVNVPESEPFDLYD